MSQAWQQAVFDALVAANVRHEAYVPQSYESESSQAEVIRRAHDAPGMKAVPLTPQPEGFALVRGGWPHGERGVLLNEMFLG